MGGPLTSAQGLRVVPVRVPHVDALDDGRALLQGVAGVTGELHDGADVVGQVGGGEVPVLDVGLVAVAFLKGWGGGEGGQRGSNSDESGAAPRLSLRRRSLPDVRGGRAEENGQRTP